MVVGSEESSGGRGLLPTEEEEKVVTNGVMAGVLEGEPDKTLREGNFIVGDFLSCAIFPPSADGSVVPPPGRGPGAGRGGGNDFGGRGGGYGPPRENGYGGYRGRGGMRGVGMFNGGRVGDGGVPSGEWRRGERVPEGPGPRGGYGRGRGRGY